MGTGRAYGLNRMRVAGVIALLIAAVIALWLFLGGAAAPRLRRCNVASYADDTLELDLKKCSLTTLPSLARFTRLRKLDLGHNALSDLPALPPSLEILFLLGNEFEGVPASLEPLPALRMLSFKACKLTLLDRRLPASLSWLILTENQLFQLPEWLGELTAMRKLMLSNNRLASLPPSLASMGELELLRLANNRLEELPGWVLELPKLTWLAIAGNPFVQAPPPRASLEPISLADVHLGKILGEGTSGVVHKAEYNGATVAVKLYKQPLSSDGRNIDEVRASCALDHPNVVKFRGYFEEPQLGAVLEWTEGYSSLGRPPSLDSCTRDTYAADAAFSAGFIRRAARSVAAAMAHVHAAGLCHGDLYAHNTLVVRETGEAKVGDFGAAFYYRGLQVNTWRFEQMELRAFGIMLAELLDRQRPGGPELAELRRLADACSAPFSNKPGTGLPAERVRATCTSFAAVSAALRPKGRE